MILWATMACAICSSFALMMMSCKTAACNLLIERLGCALGP